MLGDGGGDQGCVGGWDMLCDKVDSWRLQSFVGTWGCVSIIVALFVLAAYTWAGWSFLMHAAVILVGSVAAMLVWRHLRRGIALEAKEFCRTCSNEYDRLTFRWDGAFNVIELTMLDMEIPHGAGKEELVIRTVQHVPLEKAPPRDKTDVTDRGLPCRLLLEISFGGSRVVWKKTPTVVTEEDYGVQQTITKTADIHLRHRQNPKETAELRDVQKHDISVEGGLTLGGEHAMGAFQDDSPTPTVQTLGYINLPPTLYSGVAASCRMRFCYRPGQPGPIEGSCLFHMSTNCWQSHFSLRHTDTGAIHFQICPSRHEKWEDRQQVVSTTTFSPRPAPYEVVACVRADGSQALFVDGQLEATGAGVRGLTDGWDGRRTTNYIGRWMRPDQSYPLTASVLSLELFDGDLSAGSNQLDQYL